MNYLGSIKIAVDTKKEYTAPLEGSWRRALTEGLMTGGKWGLGAGAYGALRGGARSEANHMTLGEGALSGSLIFGGIGALGGGIYGGIKGLQTETPAKYIQRLNKDHYPELLEIAQQHIAKTNKEKTNLNHPHYKMVKPFFDAANK